MPAVLPTGWWSIPVSPAANRHGNGWLQDGPACDRPRLWLATVAAVNLDGRQLGSYGVWASHLGLLAWETARTAVQELEGLGYGTVWVGEAEGKEALTHAALLLCATERLMVATGIANIWARDAVTMANGGRTLAEAYPRRFVLGIGASHAVLAERRGHEYAKPLQAMRAYLDAMDGAPWRGPALEAPPRVLAALGPRMLELAAARGAGAHTFLVSAEHTRWARDILGRGPLLAPEQAVVLAESREEARRSADRHLRIYLELPNYRRHLQRMGWREADLAGAGSDALFDALVAWGGPEEVARRLDEHLQAGADHVAVHPLTPSPDEGPLRQLRALGDALGLARGEV